MKWLYKLIGVLAGIGTSIAVALSMSFYFAQGNPLLTAFITMFALPLGFILGIVFGLKGAERVRRHVTDDLYNASRRTKALYLASIASAILGVNVVCVHFVGKTFEPPSDRLLISNLEQHRSTFDRIVTMVQADKGVERIDNDWYQFKGGQSDMKAESLAQYRKLLTSAGVPRGLQRARGGREINFYYWIIGGSVTSTKIKGYAYSETPPTPLFSTLDGIKDRVGYRHITGNWYLYYEYFPN